MLGEEYGNDFGSSRSTRRKRKKNLESDVDDDDDDSFNLKADDDEEEEDYSHYTRKRSKGSKKASKMEEEMNNTFIPPTKIFKTSLKEFNKQNEFRFAAPIPSIFEFNSNKKHDKTDENQHLTVPLMNLFVSPVMNSQITSESQLFSIISTKMKKEINKEKGIHKFNDRSKDFLLDTSNMLLQGRRKLLVILRTASEEQHLEWALKILIHQSNYGPYITCSTPQALLCDEYNLNYVISVAIVNSLIDLVQFKICPVQSFHRNCKKNLSKNSSVTPVKGEEMQLEDELTNEMKSNQMRRNLFSPKLLGLEITKFHYVFTILYNISNADEASAQYLSTEKRIFDMCSHLFHFLFLKTKQINLCSFQKLNKTHPDNMTIKEGIIQLKEDTWRQLIDALEKLDLKEIQKISLIALDLVERLSFHLSSFQFDLKNFLRSLLFFFYMDNESLVDQFLRIFKNFTKNTEIASQIPMILSGDNQSDPTFYDRILSLVSFDKNQQYNEMIFDLFYNLSQIGKIFSDSFSLTNGVYIFIKYILHNSLFDHKSQNVNQCRRLILTLQNLATSPLNLDQLKSSKESILSIVSNDYAISSEVLDILIPLI